MNHFPLFPQALFASPTAFGHPILLDTHTLQVKPSSLTHFILAFDHGSAGLLSIAYTHQLDLLRLALQNYARKLLVPQALLQKLISLTLFLA